jgi:L-fucose mutarotase
MHAARDDGDAGLAAQEPEMLKNIDPILSPELLSTLRAMGHGDELAIVDANYPAQSSGRTVVRMDGVASATRLLEAVLSLLPLDEFVPCAAFHMQVVDDPTAQLPIFAEFRALLERYEPKAARLEGIERFAFYERVKSCFAVLATGERRLYANLILKKGIVRP